MIRVCVCLFAGTATTGTKAGAKVNAVLAPKLATPPGPPPQLDSNRLGWSTGGAAWRPDVDNPETAWVDPVAAQLRIDALEKLCSSQKRKIAQLSLEEVPIKQDSVSSSITPSIRTRN